MRCPVCSVWVFVKETRQRPKLNAKYRRYECANGHRFSTLEQVIRVDKQKLPSVPEHLK